MWDTLARRKPSTIGGRSGTRTLKTPKRPTRLAIVLLIQPDTFHNAPMIQADYYADPSPHLFLRNLINPMVYRSARFPVLEQRPLGRTGRDLYMSDPDFAEVCRSHGWDALRQLVTGKTFVRDVIARFADAMRDRGCLVDPDDWSLAPYAETREETESADLGSDQPLNELFVRFDFQAAEAAYAKPPHVDWPRRLVGGVLFCCDAAEQGLEGGEFGMWRETAPSQQVRLCASPELVRSYPAKHNTGVLFLNSPDGFHGPTPITQLTGQRRWIYYSISSRHPVWPT